MTYDSQLLNGVITRAVFSFGACFNNTFRPKIEMPSVIRNLSPQNNRIQCGSTLGATIYCFYTLGLFFDKTNCDTGQRWRHLSAFPCTNASCLAMMVLINFRRNKLNASPENGKILFLRSRANLYSPLRSFN